MNLGQLYSIMCSEVVPANIIYIYDNRKKFVDCVEIYTHTPHTYIRAFLLFIAV